MSDAKPGFNHWLVSGPLVTLTGFLSYFYFFYQWPATRDVPWVNLPLVWAGAAMTLWGAKRAFGRGGWRIAASLPPVVIALLPAGFLTLYVFVISYQMPEVTAKSDTGAALPALTLTAHDGTEVNLQEAAAGKLVLIFFRGAW